MARARNSNIWAGILIAASMSCLFLDQSAAARQQTGRIVGWGSQVVGVDLDGRFTAIAAGDLNDDCEVDFEDFALLAENWLTDCYLDPDNPACAPK